MQSLTSLKAQLGDLSVSLHLSSITGLMELSQDEFLPLPIEYAFELKRLSATITEDQGNNNISMSRISSTNVVIPSLRIEKGSTGSFVITSADKTSDSTGHHSTPEQQLELSRLNVEVQQLRQALQACSDNLRDTQLENTSLKEAIRLLESDFQSLKKPPPGVASGAEGETSSPKGKRSLMRMGSGRGASYLSSLGIKGNLLTKDSSSRDKNCDSS